MFKSEAYPYHIRLKTAVIIVILMMIMLFKFWPKPSLIKDLDTVFYENRPMIMLDPTVVTIQNKSIVKPSPASEKMSTVSEPEKVITSTDTPTPAISSSSKGTSDTPGRSGEQSSIETPKISEKPTRLPSVVRIVEPVVPDVVKNNRIKAELTVRVLVGVDGSVEKAEILEIRSFNTKTGKYEKVNDIAFGIKEATLQAAMGWKFRPAFEGNEKVKFWSKHLFTFGT